MKTCKACGVEKPLDEFYKNHGKDTRQNRCKVCVAAASRANRAANIERYRQYDRNRANLAHRVEARKRYAETEAGKEAVRRAKRAYRQRDTTRDKAHVILGNAVRDGKVRRLPCLVCGCETVEAHHVAYDLPLDVVWLCPTHHKQTHKEHRRRMQSVNAGEYGKQEAA